MDLTPIPTRSLAIVCFLPALLAACDTMPYKQVATTSTVGKETELPAPAELAYTITAVKRDKVVYGRGQIRWEANRSAYAIHRDLRVGNTPVIQYKSEGALGKFGLRPDRYWERHQGRTDQGIKFDWRRKLLTFADDTMLLPLHGTELDRGSVVMQLVAVARKNADRLVPGTEIAFLVAGSRSLTEWRFKIHDPVDVNVAGKSTRAWHFVKNVGDDDNSEKVEVWLSPEHDWYPVKLGFEEKPGESMSLLLSRITRLPAHLAEAYPEH